MAALPTLKNCHKELGYFTIQVRLRDINPMPHCQKQGLTLIFRLLLKM